MFTMLTFGMLCSDDLVTMSAVWSDTPCAVITKPNFWICVNSYSASRNNRCTVGGDGGCRVGEVLPPCPTIRVLSYSNWSIFRKIGGGIDVTIYLRSYENSMNFTLY